MSLATLAGFGVEWLELDRPFEGLWIIRAKLDIGDDAIPVLGPFTCLFNDGTSIIEYRGTLLLSSDDNGDAYVIGVAGNGKFGTVLPGVDYSLPQPRTVARDILTACGEVAGDISSLDTLPRINPVYSCLSGRATKQLTDLCRTIGARWYAHIDGTINIDVPSWPTYTNEAFVVHKPNAYGVAHAEPSLPDIAPGMIVDGKRIARVRYWLDENGLSAYLGLAQ